MVFNSYKIAIFVQLYRQQFFDRIKRDKNQESVATQFEQLTIIKCNFVIQSF